MKIGSIAMETTEKCVHENGVDVILGKDHDNPTKCSTFYNPVMKTNREFVLAALKSYIHEHPQFRPVRCLEAFGASGVTGLQWKHHFGSDVAVTVNDISPEAVKSIKENCEKNDYAVSAENTQAHVNQEGMSSHTGGESTESMSKTIEVIEKDANILMYQRQFHFIHLDPFGSNVQYLDAAFRNVYNKGIVILTSTDVGSLYGKCPSVVLRNYGSNILKSDYLKELAARVVIGAAARSAAKCNKGFDVLYCVAAEHFVHVALYIKRGAKQADFCLTKINQIAHCQMCADWAVLPNTNCLEDGQYQHLPCTCNDKNPGKTALKLGPAWCGQIFNTNFVQLMGRFSKEMELSNKVQNLLSTILEESRCGVIDKEESILESDTTESDSTNNKRPAESAPTSNPPAKKFKGQRPVEGIDAPIFFYNLKRRKFKGIDIPKPAKFVDYMKQHGFCASRTHFDYHGIRTNATLAEIGELLHKFHS